MCEKKKPKFMFDWQQRQRNRNRTKQSLERTCIIALRRDRRQCANVNLSVCDEISSLKKLKSTKEEEEKEKRRKIQWEKLVITLRPLSIANNVCVCVRRLFILYRIRRRCHYRSKWETCTRSFHDFTSASVSIQCVIYLLFFLFCVYFVPCVSRSCDK